MENKMITLNASPLPVKTWRYLKINQSTIPVSALLSEVLYPEAFLHVQIPI